MQLNHLDLQVSDVQRAADFFVRHFGFARASSATSPALVILEGDGGVVLVLQRRKDDTPWPEGFHIGFLVGDVERVHAFHRAATEEGLALSAVETDGRGTRTYCRYEGFLIEVSRPRAR